MSKKRETPDHPEPLDEQAMQVLMKEYDTLRELYTHAESSAQNLFNFYLTLVSTVVGGLVVLTQFSSGGGSRLGVMSLLLYFAAAVGSAYLSALTGRYAHMARYARAIDSLRRMLIERTDVYMPAEYTPFMRDSSPIDKPVRFSPMWLFPTGTFQLVVAVINSLSLAAATWLLLGAAHVVASRPVASLITVMVIFFLTFTVNNIYSHLVINVLTQRLNVRVDTDRNMRGIAGRQ
jgi:hypothetical protein